jgi:hypothetical protein
MSGHLKRNAGLRAKACFEQYLGIQDYYQGSGYLLWRISYVKTSQPDLLIAQ